MYCGAYFTPSTSKQIHCKHNCSQRHYKERAKCRRLTEQGFKGLFLKTRYLIECSTVLLKLRILGVSKQAVSKWVQSTKIAYIDLDGPIRIAYQEINRIIKIQGNNNN